MRVNILFNIVMAVVMFMGAATANALTAVEKLGSLIYRDTELSLNFNQSCMTCHHPAAGFADPVNRRDPVNFPVSQGSDPTLFGGRNAPSAAYAGFSPIFHWDAEQNGYVGGMFWDGRATGEELGDPLAEQARGPFRNPVEMGLEKKDVVERVSIATYAPLFETVFPETDWGDVDGTYNNIARAIAAFERSQSVTRFNSPFDQFWSACADARIDVSGITDMTKIGTLPQGILSTGELKGLTLFNGKAGCAACHSTSDHEIGATPPLFTTHAYANIGIPTNPRVYELADGEPPDLGLGGRLNEADQDGKFKIPTLRNVANSAPYGHNGYFVSLEEIVNFFNTRDVPGSLWYDIEPDVLDNIDTQHTGNLKLSAKEESWLVAFLKTLTDRQQ